MQAVILQCRPRARFHFGKVAPDNNTSLNDTSEYLPSDTLFSAIINTLAIMQDKTTVDRIVGHFDAGRVRISSGFYLLRMAARDIFFLPKPASLAFEVTEGFKEFNKVKFVSREVWEKGWPFSEWKTRCYFLQKGAVVVAKTELPELTTALETLQSEKEQEVVAAKICLFNIEDYPRVKVHAQGQQDAFFYLATVCIADTPDLTNYLPESSVHFYFLLDSETGFEENPDYAHILTALYLLPDQGIGGERSAGCGLFEKIDFQPFESITVEAPIQQCSVSLTLPLDETEFQQMAAYAVQTRGGREYTGGKLRFVRMMNEGAVSKVAIQGRIAELGDSDPKEFLRFGKAFCLPVRAITPPKQDN